MPPKDGDDPTAELARLRAEIARLKAKMAAIPDRDVRAAIQERVDALSAKVAAQEAEVGPEAAPEPEVPPEPPTPEQIDRSERLVRQAMLERQRGNKVAVTKLLEEAVAVAPGAPATLEALGDDFAERRRVKEALAYYRKAMALGPKNVGLEKKHAMLVFNVGTAGSLDDQLRANLSDSVFLSGSDHVASFGSAKLLTYFFPGLGHLVLGRTVAGFGFLGAWIASVVWTGVALLHGGGGGRLRITSGLLPPAVLWVVVMLVALSSLGTDRTAARSKGKPARPKPPVDLPFD